MFLQVVLNAYVMRMERRMERGHEINKYRMALLRERRNGHLTLFAGLRDGKGAPLVQSGMGFILITG